MVCLGNIQHPKLTRYDTQKYKEIGLARVIGTGWHPSRCVRSGRSRARVAHSGRRMLRAARHRARIRAHGQKAPRGVAVRPRHRSQQPGISRNVTEPRRKFISSIALGSAGRSRWSHDQPLPVATTHTCRSGDGRKAITGHQPTSAARVARETVRLPVRPRGRGRFDRPTRRAQAARTGCG